VRGRIGSAVLAAALLGGHGCGGGDGEAGAPATSEAAGPGLVLLTLDTFRADHLGCAGNPVVRTPHLDRLERRGAHWIDAVSPVPLTTPSHASILSGLSPRAHGLVKNRMRLAPDIPTLPERLAEEGWRTGAVVSARIVLGPEFGLDRGFDSYEVIDPETRPASGEGARTAAAAAAWLEENGGPGSFLWAHFFDAHLPYAPPPPWDGFYDPGYDGPYREPSLEIQQRLHEGAEVAARDVTWLAAQYAGEVSFVDECVGRIARAAEARRQSPVIAVTGDHGEGLYEHRRYFGHDILLYEPSLRVPLIVAGPGVPPGLHAETARTLDLYETLLGLAGVAGDPTEGRDLLHDPPLTGDDAVFVAETHPARGKSDPVYALRVPGRAKVLWIPRRGEQEWYDLAADPAEANDLYGTRERYFRVLHEDLEIDLRTRPVGEARTVDDERGGPDEATAEALKALGYAN
jgi:arylsulfatase A-like enzyme